MACNCATQEQLDRLYAEYGRKDAERRGGSVWTRIVDTVWKIGAWVCVALIAAPMTFFILWKGMFAKDKNIDVRRFFGFFGVGRRTAEISEE